MLPQLLEDTQSNRTQAQQPDLAAGAAAGTVREGRAVAADRGGIVCAEGGHLELHSRLAGECDGLLLHDFSSNRQGVAVLDFLEALGVGTLCRIAVVDTVHVLDQAASRVELLGQEERRQVRAAASEQRNPSLAIASNEAGNHRDSALMSAPA